MTAINILVRCAYQFDVYKIQSSITKNGDKKMITLNAYAHNATEQQRKSMKGQGLPLDFIKALETGEIDLTRALENVKSHVAYDNRNGFHTADIHCALAAVHFVKARKDGASEETLGELRADFFKEMTLYFDSVDFLEKTDLEKHLYRIVSTKIVPWEIEQ